VLEAGTDPTYIPGLDAAAPGEPEADPPEPGQETAQQAVDAVDDAAEGGSPVTADADDEDEAPPEGPSFEVSDRRGSVVVDGHGVVFRLDDTEARFRWSEVGSVEIGGSRFGRRFEVAVGTRDHRRFEAEVEAPSRKQLPEWTADLDAVLDAWFDDGEK
jgi:hypothetical protein